MCEEVFRSGVFFLQGEAVIFFYDLFGLFFDRLDLISFYACNNELVTQSRQRIAFGSFFEIMAVPLLTYPTGVVVQPGHFCMYQHGPSLFANVSQAFLYDVIAKDKIGS